tara:strand:- start:507 stop:755 length:249 start_codon:yes stop_codon:yes gene_type:complete
VLKISGSYSEDLDMELTEVLLILQDQINIMSMINDFETKNMSASEEVKFLQFILDAGLVWAMGDVYIKRVETALENNVIYFN